MRSDLTGITSKSEFRAHALEYRSSLPISGYLNTGSRLTDRLIREITTSTRSVHVYIGSIAKREIDTLPFIAWCLRKKITLWVPRIEPDKTLTHHQLTELTALETGKFDLVQPPDGDSVLPYPPDLIVVPGLVFDKKGFRVGYGKGYYDRFLKNYKGISKLVGLVFEPLLVDQVPVEPHDVPVDRVITENQTLVI